MAKNGILFVGLGMWGSRFAKEYMALVQEGKSDKIYLIDAKEDAVERFKKNNAESIDALTKAGKLYIMSADATKLGEDVLSNVNVAHICAINSQHYPITSYLLDHGISVLVEKPISEDLDEVNKLLERTKKENLIVKTGLIFRFDNAVKKIKEIYDSGALGKVYFMRFKWEFLRPAMEGVDIVWDTMPHLVDIYQYLTNEDPFFVEGIKTQFRRDEKGELATIVLSVKSDVKGIFNISWFSTAKDRIIEIYGEKKVLRADLGNQTVALIDVNDLSKIEQVPVEKNNTMRAEAQNLIDDANRNQNSANTIDVGLKGLIAIDQINKKIREVPK